MPDHADPFFTDPPFEQTLSHELARRDEPRDPFLESHHEAMGPEDGGIRSGLLLRGETAMHDGVHVHARLTSVTHRTFREHEAVGTAQPEVVNRHDNRYAALAGGQENGRAERGVGVVHVHDIGRESIDDGANMLLLGARVQHPGRCLRAFREVDVRFRNQLHIVSARDEVDLVPDVPILTSRDAIEAVGVEDPQPSPDRVRLNHDPHPFDRVGPWNVLRSKARERSKGSARSHPPPTEPVVRALKLLQFKG